MKYTDKLIKIGRTETVIFEGDAIVNIPEIGKTYFASNDNRRFSTPDERKAFNDWAKVTFPDNKVTYLIGVTQKVSKAFLREWKGRPDVTKVQTTSPNGNIVFRYVYNP